MASGGSLPKIKIGSVLPGFDYEAFCRAIADDRDIPDARKEWIYDACNPDKEITLNQYAYTNLVYGMFYNHPEYTESRVLPEPSPQHDMLDQVWGKAHRDEGNAERIGLYYGKTGYSLKKPKWIVITNNNPFIKASVQSHDEESTIYLSEAFLKLLDEDKQEAALAHEVKHVLDPAFSKISSSPERYEKWTSRLDAVTLKVTKRGREYRADDFAGKLDYGQPLIDCLELASQHKQELDSQAVAIYRHAKACGFAIDHRQFRREIEDTIVNHSSFDQPPDAREYALRWAKATRKEAGKVIGTIEQDGPGVTARFREGIKARHPSITDRTNRLQRWVDRMEARDGPEEPSQEH